MGMPLFYTISAKPTAPSAVLGRWIADAVLQHTELVVFSNQLRL